MTDLHSVALAREALSEAALLRVLHAQLKHRQTHGTSSIVGMPGPLSALATAQ